MMMVERLLQIVCTLLSLTVAVQSGVCPYGWRDYPNSTSCYLITGYRARYSFDRAVDKCAAHQAKLIAVGGQNEMNWLVKEVQLFSSTGLPPKMAWWVGLEDKGQGQGIKYLNGSKVDLNLLPWPDSTPPPPSPARRCGSVVNSTVYMSDCSSWYGLVCERDKTLPLTCDEENAWAYINGSCFKYFPTLQTWYQAQSVCADYEGDLAKVTTLEELSFIWDNFRLSSSMSWVGLKSDPRSKTYNWTDGSLADESLAWWNVQQPQNLTYMTQTDPDLCAAISGNGTRRLSSWMTEDCNERHHFTCSKLQGMCPDGWVSHMGSCYKFHAKSRMTWPMARQFCLTLGADLIAIPTQSHQELVNSYLTGLKDAGVNSLWLGLTDTLNRTFQWVDRRYSLKWTNWADGAPTDTPGSREVAYIDTGDKSGKWQLSSGLSTSRGVACFMPGTTVIKEVESSKASIQCPDQWEVAGDTCVYVSLEAATWSQASLSCQRLDAQFLVISSAEVQTYLNSRVYLGPLWIGLSDRSREGKFTWVNGTEVKVTNWAPGQPDNRQDENCVLVKAMYEWVGAQWFDTDCQQPNRYVCQKQTEASVVQPTTDPGVKDVPYSARCGDMWEERPGTDNCYQFRDTMLSWLDALELCQAYNGSLVSINSRDEQSYIEGRLRALDSVDFWIGASDRRREAGWQWEDGSPFAYLNWHSGEPNDQTRENCAAINTQTMMWFDYPCQGRTGFVCEKIAESSLTTPISSSPAPTNLPAGQHYGCPLGWLSYDSSCYLIRRMPVTWTEAQVACRREGGALASIGSDMENKFVWSQLPKEACQNTHSNDAQCQEWADAMECQKNPSWMSLNCQMSCSMCNQGCSDRHTHFECKFWANLGECVRNPSWMWDNCALSCGCDTSINEGFWLGLHDRFSQMTFVWDDLSPMTFTNWLPNEPNNYQGKHEDCVKIHTPDGAWSDELCDQQNVGYVCKRRKSVMDTPTVSPDKVGCPISGFAYKDMCYVIIDTPKTWQEARAICGGQNASLATIQDSITAAFITSELVHRTLSYWIGLSKLDGTYNWDSGRDLLYLAWGPSHTGNEKNSCVAVRSQKPVGLWEDLDCQMLQPFICETPRHGSARTTTTTTPATTTPAECSPSWTGHGDHCYKMFLTAKNWFKAQTDCESYGGSLASLHQNSSETLIGELSGLTGISGAYWIGLTDRALESSYQWSDGSLFEYSKWAKGEPNSATTAEDCVEVVGPSWEWNDLNCFLSRAYICSVVRGFPVQTTTSTVSTTPAPRCQDSDWLYHGGSCYYVSPSFGRNSTLTWFQSRRRCQAMGGDLASVTSLEENNFLTTELSRREMANFWIGLNQLEQTAYVWSDGSPSSFVAWGPREPNDFLGGERCVSVDGGRGFWRDDECMTSNGYVCKKGNNSMTPTIPVTSPVYNGVCPDGFIGGGTSTKCYYIGGKGSPSSQDRTRGWEDARDFCRNLTSASLVDIGSIHGLADQNLVTSLMWDLDSDLWVGLSDRLTANQYRWQDNSEVTFTYWADGQPVRHFPWSLNKDNCVEVLRHPYAAGDTARWNDGPCDKKNAFLCQTMKSTKPTPSSQEPTTSPSSPVDTTIKSPTCPDGYFWYKSACYSVFPRPQTWSEARETCQSFHGDLASTADIFEMARLDMEILDSQVGGQAWIGLSYDQVTSMFVWADGWPVALTFWTSGQPVFPVNDSCVMLTKARWEERPCSDRLPFICQVNTDSPPTPTPSPRGQCIDPNQVIFGASCYLALPNERVSWPEAIYRCAQVGMQLVSVHSETENKFVRAYIDQLSASPADALIHRDSVWLGLQADLGGGHRWSDRSPVVYFNWEDGEPSSVNPDNQCTVLSRQTGGWSILACIGPRLGYVCKSNTVEVTTASLSTSSSAVTDPSVIPTNVQESDVDQSPVFYDITKIPDAMATVLTGPQAPVEDRVPSSEASLTAPREAGGQYLTPAYSRLDKSNKSLSGGQVGGIIIAIIGLCVISSAVVVIMRNRNSPDIHGKVTARPGYINALYRHVQDTQSGAITGEVVIGGVYVGSEVVEEADLVPEPQKDVS